MRIVGLAWVDAAGALTAEAQAFAPLPSRWGKYAPLVRAGWLALARAFAEAQAQRAVASERVGTVACGPTGSLADNRRYFEDYAESGRTLGRSSLFVYTLPTTPVAEYAIHFKWGGPLFYAGWESGRIADALELAGSFLASGEADRMAVLLEDGRSALGVALDAGTATWPAWTSGLIEKLSEYGKGIRA